MARPKKSARITTGTKREREDEHKEREKEEKEEVVVSDDEEEDEEEEEEEQAPKKQKVNPNPRPSFLPPHPLPLEPVRPSSPQWSDCSSVEGAPPVTVCVFFCFVLCLHKKPLFPSLFFLFFFLSTNLRVGGVPCIFFLQDADIQALRLQRMESDIEHLKIMQERENARELKEEISGLKDLCREREATIEKQSHTIGRLFEIIDSLVNKK